MRVVVSADENKIQWEFISGVYQVLRNTLQISVPSYLNRLTWKVNTEPLSDAAFHEGTHFCMCLFFTMVTLTAFTNGLKKCRHDLVHYYALLSENLHATSCYCRRHPKTKWNKLPCVHSKEAQNTYLSNYNAFWQSHTWLILFCSFVCLAQMNIILIPQGYFTGTGAIIWLFQCWWSNPEEYGN